MRDNNRDSNRDEDVMCWNCFTVDNVDNDIEPITLKNVRIQQREKLKVYPFLASELSKPKAVALRQKLSSHYQIGKKNSEKIHKIKELHNDEKPSEPNDNDNLMQQDENTREDKYVPLSESKSCHAGNDNKCLNDNDVHKTIKIQSNKFVVSDKSKKSTKELTDDLKNANKSISVLDMTSSVAENDVVYTNIKPTIIPVNQYISCDETDICNTEDVNSQKTSFGLNSPPTVIEIKRVDDNIDKVTKISENQSLFYDKTAIDNIEKKTQTFQQTTSEASDVVNVARNVTENSAVRNTPPNSPISLTPLKIEKLTPESDRKLFKSSISFNSSKTPEIETPSKVLKKVQIQTNSPKLGKIVSGTADKKKSESFLKYLGVSKKKYKEPLKTQNDNPSTCIEDKIKNINFKMPTSETMNEVDDNIEISVAKPTEEVIDKSSITNSESGYVGSSMTLKDLDANNDTVKSLQSRTKSVEAIKLQEDEVTITVRRDEKVFTSLSSLSNIPKMTSLSKSSIITPIRKPVKSLRWSTLSMPARKFRFEDDIYISETTPHHGATLPRRSNSPLPHERDFDRERFPINRSGLQARSESMASVYSGAGEARGGVAVRGEVQFSLLYNYRLGALEVGVRGCRDLAPVDVKRNRSDPYVKVYLLPDKSKSGKRKTKVKKNTLSPVFEETLSFVQPLSSVSSRTLWLSVWHADMFGRNDFLGEVRLPLADIVFDDPAPVWYKLHERTEQFDEQQGSRGDLIIGLKLELPDPRGKGTLRVLVKEAKNLVATKPNGLADVFCKSYLLPERGRLGKQKTGVCRRSLSPRWDHELVYRGVTAQQLAARALELSLWDRDRLASNDFMGAVRLSLATGTYMGASVNWMDSVGKEVTLWQTMLDRPNFWVEGSLPLRPQLIN